MTPSSPSLERTTTISTCPGGRRWDEYRRRNIRTYSSMSREVLSALRITHVLNHNDASESGFTTPSAYIKDAGWRRASNGVLARTGAVVSRESGTQLAHWIAQKPARQQFSTDSQSANLFGRPIEVVTAYRPVSGLPTNRELGLPGSRRRGRPNIQKMIASIQRSGRLRLRNAESFASVPIR